MLGKTTISAGMLICMMLYTAQEAQASSSRAATTRAQSVNVNIETNNAHHLDATSSAQPAKPQALVGPAQSKPNSGSNETDESSAEGLVHGTWVLAAFTLLLGIGAVWQVLETRWNARRELRAYLGADEVRDENHRELFLNSEGELTTHATLKNFGKTPAYEVKGIFAINFIDGELTDEYWKSNDWGESQIFQPSQETTLLMHGPIIKATDLAAFKIGSASFNAFAYGMISYRDSFRKKHVTKFCFKIEYRNGSTKPPAWDWYEKYNQAD